MVVARSPKPLVLVRIQLLLLKDSSATFFKHLTVNLISYKRVLFLCPCNRIGICDWLKPSILEVRLLSRALMFILDRPSILKRYNVHGFRVRR